MQRGWINCNAAGPGYSLSFPGLSRDLLLAVVLRPACGRHLGVCIATAHLRLFRKIRSFKCWPSPNPRSKTYTISNVGERMERRYSISVMMEDTSTSFINKGFLKCHVSERSYPFRQRVFIFCLHCLKMRSPSWFYGHRKDCGGAPSQERLDFFNSRYDHFVRDIESEIDLLDEVGSLFRESSRTGVMPESGHRGLHRFRPTTDSHQGLLPAFPTEFDEGGEEPDEFYENSPEQTSLSDERTVRCISDCFDEFCFLDKTISCERFVSLSRAFFEPENGLLSSSVGISIRVKARILSRVVRKVFVLLSLSKTQADVLNRFLKTVLISVSAWNEDFARSIHAVYFSCLRECVSQNVENDRLVRVHFQTCRCFSIAVDTALFGQDHVLSCIARFVFDDRVEQFPLFFSVCLATTGEEHAQFMSNRLKAMNAPLSKFCGVTTDGASNMMGPANGMVRHLRLLIQRELGVLSTTFNHVWCLAHRLNLVVADFQKIPYINSVLIFARWFSSKRKTVAYRKWLKQSFPNSRFKKVPKPSETRWAFYRDVLDSLLTQTVQIEDFLRQDSEFQSFRWKLHPLCEDNSGDRTLFFSNTFVVQHFKFSLKILDTLLTSIVKMQHKYTIFSLV